MVCYCWPLVVRVMCCGGGSIYVSILYVVRFKTDSNPQINQHKFFFMFLFKNHLAIQ